ncbi:MAG: O-antigen ligase family protein [Myxococcota bacterium]|nr:O-antigen ligase family protein [Myxococcota bacterium]
MTLRRVLAVTIFLAFVADKGTTYEQWFGPFSWAHTLLFEPLPYNIRLFDHITAVCLFLATRQRDGKARAVQPMRNALLLAAATTAVCFIYGILRGGSAWAASWQVYLMMSGLLFAFSVGAVFRTPDHYVMLAKALLAAAAYRAVMCCVFYLLCVHNQDLKPPPEMITTHDDTVLWVVTMLLLLIRLFGPARVSDRVKYGLFLLLIGVAVSLNQRRLAWVSLAMGIVVVVALTPPVKQIRRIQRLAIIVPIVALYVAIGWGRSERIFKPLKSFATVSTEEDQSTRARNAENLGLIATSNASGMLMGTGWGRPYIEVTDRFSIAQLFPLWQYIPHNSILGLLAYTGVFGFCGYWMAVPTAMFLNARMARLAKTRLAREIGIIGAAQLVVCANQFYGDMGIYFTKPIYMMSLSYALAMRLPILVGAWPGSQPTAAPIRSRRSDARPT